MVHLQTIVLLGFPVQSTVVYVRVHLRHSRNQARFARQQKCSRSIGDQTVGSCTPLDKPLQAGRIRTKGSCLLSLKDHPGHVSVTSRPVVFLREKNCQARTHNPLDTAAAACTVSLGLPYSWLTKVIMAVPLSATQGRVRRHKARC